MTLRDNTETADPRLGRLRQFDERSRSFRIRDAVGPRKQRSYSWRCLDYFDQGSEGSCVAHGIGHEAAARPSEVTGLTTQFLVENIYWPAQRIDPWEGGSYPNAVPHNDGTSVLCGLKVAQQLGWFSEYRWSFSLDDLILGIGYAGPAVLGLDWYEGMFNTDASGFIHPTGQIAGGHCICALAVNIRKDYVTLRNSWGRDWGIDGQARIAIPDLKKLLDTGGEAAFMLGRRPLPRRHD